MSIGTVLIPVEYLANVKYYVAKNKASGDTHEYPSVEAPLNPLLHNKNKAKCC
jgi:hypothetical protein